MPKANFSTVILDNATLRGALIALGLLPPPHAQAKEPIKVFDIHIASAEILIESMLLYEHIYIPNIHEKYPALVPIIQAHIGTDIVKNLPLEEEKIKIIENFAERDFVAWPLARKDLVTNLHRFAGPLAPRLKWDETIMDEYDNVRKLNFWYRYTDAISHYYGGSTAQAAEAAYISLPEHLAGTSLESLDVAILWLTYRTCIYDCISWFTGIAYVPHPQRAAIWKAVNLRRSNPMLFANEPLDILLHARTTVGRQVNDALGMELFDLEIPPFFTYVLSKSKSLSNILDTVMSIRDQKNVKALRTILGKISNIHYGSDKTTVSKVLNLKKEFDYLRKDLTMHYQVIAMPKVKPTIQLAGIIGVQFDIPIPSKIRSLLSALQIKTKPHLAILHEINKTTNQIWQLSYLYDKVYQGEQYINIYEKFEEDRLLLKKAEELELATPADCQMKLEDFLSNHPGVTCQLAILDIDDLDYYNTMYGHWFGDRIILEISLKIMDFGVDVVSRVAGDTFIIVVFKQSSDQWIKDLKSAISIIPLYEWTNQPVNEFISISAGLATAPTEARTADRLFKIAENRLKEEKRDKKKNRKRY